MNSYKNQILSKICYTEFVYERINKKLNKNYKKEEIEIMISTIIKENDGFEFKKIGKNIYITNPLNKIRITINTHSFRIITVDDLNKK
ncbi:MAG: DUF3781 domain-containing protein [Cytophagales bacterium]|nr:MAG: DUF3781 domain-containing protein [Cytophagales bacterium]